MSLHSCRRLRNLAWLALSLGDCLPGQQANSGSLSGTVVNRATNAPIRKAVVTLSTVESQPQDAVAWTDAAGRFSFSFLPAGRYQLHAAKSGFQGAAFGTETQNRPPGFIVLAVGENRAAVNLRLPPLSVVSGVVLDEAGDPLPGAEVQLMIPGFQRRARTLLQGPSTATDREGQYRLLNVTAGKYAVMAQMLQPVVKAQAEATAGQVPEVHMYGFQYFPGTASAEAGTLITVEPGRDIEQINFQLPLAGRPATLQGKVAMPPGGTPVGSVRVMVLALESGSRYVAGTQALPPDFTFQTGSLRLGKYRVIARASFDGKEYGGSQEVDLRAQTDPNVTINLEAGIDLSGRVKLEGTGAAGDLARSVSLIPGDPQAQQSDRPLRALVKPDGSYTIQNVLPGVWDINPGPVPPGGYLKSMFLGTQDVLTEEMVITGKTTAALNIVISSQAASVEGKLVRANGEPANGVILLAPQGKLQSVTSFYRFATADEKGHYEMKGLAPGRYRLYPLEEADPAYTHDAELLRPLESAASSVELKEGVTTKQNLTFAARPGAGQ